MKPDSEKALGDVIRSRRLAKKMTLEALGDAAGIDVSQLSKIERGLCRTRVDTYGRIALALGWTPAAMWHAASASSRPAA
jgi:transcriptional regulator with XRE-family HTH domain